MLTANWVRDMFPETGFLRIGLTRSAKNSWIFIRSPTPQRPDRFRGKTISSSNDNVTWYDFNNFAGRIDHNFGTKERIYGRYVWNNQLLHQNSNGLSGSGADLREGTKINKGRRVRFVDDSESHHNT